MKKLITFIREFTCDFIQRKNEVQVATHSSSAAFFLILSVFPFAILLFTLLRYVYGSAQLMMNSYHALIPAVLHPLADQIILELYEKANTSFIPISGIAALYSASRGVRAMLYGLNTIHRSHEKRNFFIEIGISILYTLVLLAAIILTLTLIVFGNRLFQSIVTRLPELKELTELFSQSRYLIVAGILWFAFAAIYKVFPRKKLRLLYQMPAAVFTVAGWLIFSYTFSFYVDHFGNYSFTYGSVTIIILLLVWVYFLMYIFFLGGLLGACLDAHFSKSGSRHLHS